MFCLRSEDKLQMYQRFLCGWCCDVSNVLSKILPLLLFEHSPK